MKDKEKDNDICFVVMPFGGLFDLYFEEIYVPAIKECKLTPKRADSLYRSSSIINDIWEYTVSSKLILADLTGKNPNVFYELGLAHAIAKPAVLLTQNMDDIPFDLRGLRIIEYNREHPNWGEILKSKIITSINETLESPLKSVLPTFIEVKSEKKKHISEAEKTLIDMQQDIDLLKKEIRTFSSGSTVSTPVSLVLRLTPIELDILKLYAIGLTTKDIANKLNRTVKSIDSHRYDLMEKFNVSNSVELISKAISTGIINS